MKNEESSFLMDPAPGVFTFGCRSFSVLFLIYSQWIRPSVVVHGKEEREEPRAQGAARERRQTWRCAGWGSWTCLVLEVMVLHKIVILRGTRGCAHKSGEALRAGPYLPTPLESSAFDSL